MNSSVVDYDSKTANMYGCEPCPKCGSKYRCMFNNKPDIIQCDGCQYEEVASGIVEGDNTCEL